MLSPAGGFVLPLKSIRQAVSLWSYDEHGQYTMVSARDLTSSTTVAESEIALSPPDLAVLLMTFEHFDHRVKHQTAFYVMIFAGSTRTGRERAQAGAR
jgi:hypothetical protein